MNLGSHSSRELAMAILQFRYVRIDVLTVPPYLKSDAKAVWREYYDVQYSRRYRATKHYNLWRDRGGLVEARRGVGNTSLDGIGVAAGEASGPVTCAD